MTNHRSRTSSTSRLRGVTLVEVVAGLALLGSLLTSLLVARLSLARQRIESEKRIAAVHACDQLLTKWLAAGTSVPRQAAGRTGAGDRFSWRTRMTRTHMLETTSIPVVRVEITEAVRPSGKALAWAEVFAP